MPVHTNSIGANVFIDLVGRIELRQEQVEIHERPGIDGVGIRKTGARGKPFQLVSINYVATFQAAETTLLAYQAGISGTPVALQRNSIPYGNFVVLAVTEARPPRPVTGTVGGFIANAPNEVRQECLWTLIG